MCTRAALVSRRRVRVRVRVPPAPAHRLIDSLAHRLIESSTPSAQRPRYPEPRTALARHRDREDPVRESVRDDDLQARCGHSTMHNQRLVKSSSRSRSRSGLSGRLRLERTNERKKGMKRERGNNIQVRVEEGSCLLTSHVRGPCSVPCAASLSGSSCVCLDNKPVCHHQLDDQMGVLRERASQPEGTGIQRRET